MTQDVPVLKGTMSWIVETEDDRLQVIGKMKETRKHGREEYR